MYLQHKVIKLRIINDTEYRKQGTTQARGISLESRNYALFASRRGKFEKFSI